jgi:tetratricopeptide (TPR) repeat protein
MLTFAGIFAVLLGATAWKTLDDQRKSAEENLNLKVQVFEQKFEQLLDNHQSKLNNALRDIQNLRDEVRRDFPMFGKMQRNFATVLIGLESACQCLRAIDDNYTELTWQQREQILFYEKAVADSILLDTQGYDDQLSEIYRYLGIFYGSRFSSKMIRAHARGEDCKRVLQEERPDIDRARFYFETSLRFNLNNYLTYSHAGYFTMYYFDHELASYSKERLEKAATRAPNAQRPLVNLSILEVRAFSDADAALKALAQAEKRPEYEASGSSPQPERIAYCKAMALALKGDTSNTEAERAVLYQEALRALDVAASAGSAWIKSSFAESDYQGPGDGETIFYKLGLDANFKEPFDEVSRKISTI